MFFHLLVVEIRLLSHSIDCVSHPEYLPNYYSCVDKLIHLKVNKRLLLIVVLDIDNTEYCFNQMYCNQ